MERRCIVNRESTERDELLRFVLGPSDNNNGDNSLNATVVPDLKEKLPGRGVWVTCSKSCVEEAVAKKLFARAFKTKCEVPDDLPQTIETLLEKRCLNALSLAKKAGQVITGFEKVSSAMSKKPLDMLIEAEDGAKDGQNKLEKKFNAIFADGKIIKLFTSAQMDMAFGSTNVIHAAITHGNMTQNVQAAADKLAKYRG